MRPLITVVSILVLGTAAPALAQLNVQVHITPPVIRFEAPPPLVVVEPGVQVVPDYDREVFFVDGFYWCREGDHWFRARDHRGGWGYVERREVPVTLVRYEPGRFRHYKVVKTRTVVERGGGETRVIRVKEKKFKHGGHGHGRDD